MIVAAAMAALIIVYATFSYLQNRESLFQQQVRERFIPYEASFQHIFEDDSLHVRDYKGEYVLLDFWSSWSRSSLDSHKFLSAFKTNHSDTLTVIAASVREDSQRVREYRRVHGYPFEYVDGTALFKRLNIPGIPSQILIDPGGSIIGTYVGYTDSSRYDSLKAFITR